MPDYTVLVMDAMDTDGDELEQQVQAVKTVLKNAAPHITPISLLGTEAHDRFFEQCGKDWTAWQSFIAAGVHYDSREPICNAVYCLGTRVSRSAGAVMQEALAAKRMGLCWSNGRVFRVVNVVVEDPDDWKHGWVLTTEGQGVDPSGLTGV